MTGSRFHFWVFDPVPEPNMSAHIGVLPASDFHACLSRLMRSLRRFVVLWVRPDQVPVFTFLTQKQAEIVLGVDVELVFSPTHALSDH